MKRFSYVISILIYYTSYRKRGFSCILINNLFDTMYICFNFHAHAIRRKITLKHRI